MATDIGIRHAAIHWKVEDAPGVVIVDGVIRDWPSSLGEPPTDKTVATWITEYKAAMVAKEIQTQAQAAITKSDISIIRCIEAGITVPAEWQEYRAALRAIISGSGTTTMPKMPDYPEGT